MTFTITKERLTAHGPEGVPMGYITFPQVKAGLVNIESVVIYPEFRGQCVAEAMMEALLTHLSGQNRHAALTCPYAQQYVEDRPAWKKILPDKIHFTRH